MQLWSEYLCEIKAGNFDTCKLGHWQLNVFLYVARFWVKKIDCSNAYTFSIYKYISAGSWVGNFSSFHSLYGGTMYTRGRPRYFGGLGQTFIKFSKYIYFIFYKILLKILL